MVIAAITMAKTVHKQPQLQHPVLRRRGRDGAIGMDVGENACARCWLVASASASTTSKRLASDEGVDAAGGAGGGARNASGTITVLPQY